MFLVQRVLLNDIYVKSSFYTAFYSILGRAYGPHSS